MLFEQASRLKLRFKVQNGLITTEDVWDLSLTNLDTLARALNKEVKDSQEESFITVKSKTNEKLETAFEVVKHIIDVKLKEKKAKEDAVEKQQKKQQLLALIGQKENEILGAKSIDELRKELEAL